MAIYVVTTRIKNRINPAPATREEEVLQNVVQILSTPKFSVPLDRDFGISQTLVDKPVPAVMHRLIAEIMDAIETYEPRAVVNSVTFEQGDTPGQLIPQVEVSILDE